MASTYSTNLKIELMGTGENSGTWGTITNTNLGTAFEQAVIGLGNPDYTSDANLTITLTNSNAAQAARALVLNVTSAFGSLTATRELIVPTIQKQYIVQNNTTGGQSITVKTSAGTGITVPNGRKAHLYVNGTDVIQMFDFVDINGGTIDGATVGAASASTGAFTSLTASGATTLNGAVALGDASGDLITVPGTVNSNLLFTDATYDIGASGATRPRDLFLSRNLTVGGTLTLAGGVNLNGNVTVGDSSADTLTINSTITSNLIFTDNTYDIGASGATRPRSLFLAGNITAAGNQTLTGALTVDSTTDSSSTTTGSIQTHGGVGIAKALFVGTTVTAATLNLTNALGTAYGGTGLTSFTSGGVVYASSTSALATGSALVFNGTNLGIGVTPSANWTASGSQKALQLGEYAALSGSGVGGSYYQTVLGLNCVDHTTGTKYLNNGYATAYIQDTGRHYWNIAGVGTAGNAVSFTSAMFLTEAGRLGIATTTPTSLLSVGTLGTTSAPAITLGSSVSGFGSLYFGDGTGADTYRGYIEYAHADDCLSFGTSSTERMRIVAGGNVGIGTTAPAYKLQVRGADATAVFSVGNLTEDTKLEIATFQDDRVLFRATDSSNLARSFAFETGTTERMRLTDAGNLGIGINSNNYRLNVRGGGTVGDSSVYAQFTTLDTGTANSDGFVIGVGTGSSPNANIIQQENAAIVFFTNATERARFSADGALGLGTSNPNAKLEVSLPSVTSGTVALFSSPSYESVRIFAGLSNGIGTVSTSPFGFSTNSTVRFQVGGSGQFGIGASPDYGLSGQVLTSGGASAAPTWANAGKVLQVVQGTSGSQATTTSGNWDSTGLTASITPTSSSSKILVIVSGGMEGGAGGSGDQSIGFKVYRGASSIEASTKGKVIYAGPNVYVPINFVALDSPATTSSTAYTLHFKRISGDTTASFCRDSLETANIVLMEIAA